MVHWGFLWGARPVLVPNLLGPASTFSSPFRGTRSRRAMPQFKKGDVVKLKSGGPDMTVEGPGLYGGLICHWIDSIPGKQIARSEEYDPGLLDLVRANQD
jgi:uncharacterized protein YodC (DUF2158 family)